MRYSFLFFILLGILQLSLAQKSKYRIGDFDPEWLKATSYEADPEAAALVLLNYAKIETNRYGVFYSFHQRIKIFSESALSLAEVKIPFLFSRGVDLSINGKTFNLGENGEIEEHKIEKKDIFEEEISKDLFQVKAALPQVKKGSIIEYSFKISSSGFNYIHPFYFQNVIPVLRSELETKLLSWFIYLPISKGELQIQTIEQPNYRDTYNNEYQCTQYLVENAPAFVEEPFMTSKKDYLTNIHFQLTAFYPPVGLSLDILLSWEDFHRSLTESEGFTRQIEKTPLRKMIRKGEIPGYDPEMPPLDRIEILYNFVRNSMKWNKNYNFLHLDLKDAYQKKEGNSAAINLMLVALLQEAGFHTYPVLMSTRDNGIVQQILPQLSQFNHVIAEVEFEGERILLDATSEEVVPGMLPQNDLNGFGYRVAGNNSTWIPLTPLFPLQHETLARFSINEAGLLQGSIKHTDKGYAATSIREALKESQKEEKEFFQEKIIEGLFDVKLIDFAIENTDQIQEPLISKCELATSDFVNIAGDYIYIQPMLTETLNENPLKLEKRNYPVDFSCPQFKKYVLVFTLPEGYKVESLPEPSLVLLPNNGGAFKYQTQAVGNVIQLLCQTNINQVSFPPEEYEIIKAFFEHMVEKHGEQIVLVKN